MKKDYTREIEIAYEELFVKTLRAMLENNQDTLAHLQVEAQSLYQLRENAGHKYDLDIKVRLK